MIRLLRGFLRFVWRLAFLCLIIGAVFLGWRALLRYGPGFQSKSKTAAPAMFQFHVAFIARHRFGFPRPAPEVLMPAPQAMSSADVQLKLMNWWDGKTWLPAALANGDPARGGLRLRPGSLELLEVAGVGPIETQGSDARCQVRLKVRWDFPAGLEEVRRVQEIVGLRLPKGIRPGQSAILTCLFVRHGWLWDLVSAESPWGGKLSRLPQEQVWKQVDWLY